jgi:cytochrome c biogenesis protein CcdA
MQTKQNISIASRMNVQVRPADLGARGPWFAAMTACFVGGLVLGITGLMLSLLASAGVLGATRATSLTVVSMIVASLGLLLFGAHALDRMDEAERKARDAELQ